MSKDRRLFPCTGSLCHPGESVVCNKPGMPLGKLCQSVANIYPTFRLHSKVIDISAHDTFHQASDEIAHMKGQPRHRIVIFYNSKIWKRVEQIS